MYAIYQTFDGDTFHITVLAMSVGTSAKDVPGPACHKLHTVKDGGGINKANSLCNTYGCKKVSHRTWTICVTQMYCT